MIQEIQLSNFKAFADVVKIPIKPITLIFGANSSGKSSIFQAILMLKQTLEESETKEQMLIPKGKRVDLGNYREFIHNHDMSRSFSVTIRISPINLHYAIPDLGGKDTVENSPEFDQLCAKVRSLPLGLVLTFSCADKDKEIYVSQIDLLAGDDVEPVITYVNEPPQSDAVGDEENEATKKKRRAWRLYQEFPRGILKFKDRNILHSCWNFSGKEELTEHTETDEISMNSLVENFKMLPPEERKVYKEGFARLVSSVFKDDFLTLHNFLPIELNGSHPYYSTAGDFGSEDQGNISMITLAAAFTIRKFLADCMHHIGPVRHHPERYFTFSGLKSAYVGKSGENMYDILIDNPALVEAVNRHLANLKIGYQLKIEALSGADSDIKDLYSIRLVNMAGVKIAMTDVGYGVSQVLPVILQCMLSKGKTIFIEQPELHLHPAQQAELGDLFINAALGDQKNTFIIETHSEHLILRLMRRMRETANGNLPVDMPQVSPNDVSILYVQPTDTGSVVRVLELDAEGQLLDPWPGGFFEEGFRERFS